MGGGGGGGGGGGVKKIFFRPFGPLFRPKIGGGPGPPGPSPGSATASFSPHHEKTKKGSACRVSKLPGLVPRPHYSAGPKRFGSRGPSDTSPKN